MSLQLHNHRWCSFDLAHSISNTTAVSRGECGLSHLQRNTECHILNYGSCWRSCRQLKAYWISYKAKQDKQLPRIIANCNFGNFGKLTWLKAFDGCLLSCLSLFVRIANCLKFMLRAKFTGRGYWPRKKEEFDGDIIRTVRTSRTEVLRIKLNWHSIHDANYYIILIFFLRLSIA
jgi:hypothetical protein